MTAFGKVFASGVALSVVLGPAAGARADWPMARHDAGRRAVAHGTSNIVKPKVAWSAFLGGSIAGTGVLAADVDGDGHDELIVSAGGQVAAVRGDGTAVWTQHTQATASLLGVADFDGDGRPELVLYTRVGAKALDLATGNVVWQQPPAEMGVVSLVRMGDLDGDGLPDLAIAEGRGQSGYKPQTGFVYAFGSGFASPLRVPLGYPDTAVGTESTIVDLTGSGDGALFTSGGGSKLTLVDGTTAAVIAGTGDLGFTQGGFVTGCVPGDLDGIPGDEVICLYSIGGEPTPSPTDPSRVFALKLHTSGTASLDVLWSRSLAPTESISAFGNELLADLDGDGADETVFTGRDASGVHTIHILSAATGIELASIPGASLAGVTPALPNGARLIAASVAGDTDVYAYAPAEVTKLGTIPGQSAWSSIDRARFAVSSCGANRPIAFDVDGDGLPELVTFDGQAATIQATTVGASSLTPLLVASFAPDRPLAGLWPVPPVDRSYPELAFALADGTLHLFDRSWTPTAADIRFGGYYLAGGYGSLGTSPVVASLEPGKPQQILVADSRHRLLRLDASSATPASAPVERWEDTATSPVVAPGLGGGAPSLFVVHRVDAMTSPPPLTVRRLTADGAVKWEVPVPFAPRNDMLTADFDGDGVADVLVQTQDGNSATQGTYALSGVDGHTLWSASYAGCQLPGGAAIADWNGDGVPDLVQQSSGTEVLSGVDGSILATGGPSDCYYMPIPIDVTGDGAPDAVYTASYTSSQLWANNLATQS